MIRPWQTARQRRDRIMALLLAVVWIGMVVVLTVVCDG